jgi:hypothetical protein
MPAQRVLPVFRRSSGRLVDPDRAVPPGARMGPNRAARPADFEVRRIRPAIHPKVFPGNAIARIGSSGDFGLMICPSEP